MYKIKNRIMAIIMVLAMCCSPFNVVLASNGVPVVGQITLAIEKFTLGQGYYIEPVNIPIDEDEKLGSVVARTLGSGNYNKGKDSENIGYISSVYDLELDTLDIPAYIMDEIKTVNDQNDKWLEGGDYTTTSGWMYFINNESAQVGMDQYTCKDGDVIRIEYSLYGYGADLGIDNSSWGGAEPLITPANKDELTKLVAKINGYEDKETLLSTPVGNTKIQEYYDDAIYFLMDMESDSDEINDAYEALKEVTSTFLDEQPSNPGSKDDQPTPEEKEQIKSERIQNMLDAISTQYQNESYEWSIMDMVSYGMKESLKQEDIEKYVNDAKSLIQTSKKGTDFDKTAIIFTALGLDATAVTLEEGKTFDIIDYIATMENMDMINGATFALLAYDSNNYKVVDKKWTREAIIDYIKDAQGEDGGWALIKAWGTDTDITAMVLSALAPYYNAQEDKYGVKECVEKGIACLSNLQKEDGLYAYGNAKNSNTAAMVIVALSALGIDADKDPRFIKNEVSALDALLAFETSDHKIGYTDNKSANNMATEQGFRALVNYKAFKENSGPAYVYQFIKTIDPPEPSPSPEPNPSPEPSPSQPSGGSGSGSSQPATITVSFQLIGDSHHEKAENHKEKETWIAAKSYTVSEKSTVKDVFEKALSEAGLSYINKGGNYISSINGLAEFDNGPNSGWMYMINGKHPTVGLKDYVLQGGETIVWHYTDDYTKEEGSDKWGSKPSETPSASSGGSGGGGGGSNANSQTPAAQETKSEETTPDQIEANAVHISFTDIKEGHWAKEAIETLANAGIIQGKSETKYAPNENITRAEFITLLYRMSKQEIENSNEMAFKDVKADDWFAAAVNWGVNAGIIKGMDAENFMPQSLITREQMAAMLARYIQYMQVVLIAEDNKEAFKDEVSISDYAKEPVKTLHLYNIMQGKGQNNFVPKVTATRAETAQVLFILFKSNEK